MTTTQGQAPADTNIASGAADDSLLLCASPGKGHTVTDPCENGCNGCDECTDYEGDDAEAECSRCRGDGRDPYCDYLLPCPQCQGEQMP